LPQVCDDSVELMVWVPRARRSTSNGGVGPIHSWRRQIHCRATTLTEYSHSAMPASITTHTGSLEACPGAARSAVLRALGTQTINSTLSSQTCGKIEVFRY